jgi:hypothetical protein
MAEQSRYQESRRDLLTVVFQAQKAEFQEGDERSKSNKLNCQETIKGQPKRVVNEDSLKKLPTGCLKKH